MAEADAVLSKNGTSVTIPLIESSKTLAVARDVGKPHQEYYEVGREDPLIQDNLSTGDNWTVAGILHGSNAYADAKTLAESIIKPQLDSPLSLDLSDLPSKSTYDVAPAVQNACRLTYVPGRREMVGVQLSLATVDSIVYSGGSQQTQSYGSPDAGSGIKLSRMGGSVTITDELQVTRTVGRPKIRLLPKTETLPIAVDRNKPAVDRFEISGRLTDSNAESDAQTLEGTLARKQLGSGGMNLHFQSNLFNLDKYPVTVDGSAAVRTTFSTAQTGEVNVPTLNLRVVDSR